MTVFKKLASQVAIYGISSMLARFLNFLLVPLYTRVFTQAEYGITTEFYAYSGFLTVLLSFGFETAFFRFNKDYSTDKTYGTSLSFLSVISVIFLLLLALFIQPISSWMHYENNHAYYYWIALILVIDTISAIPFAGLRQHNKAVYFATVKTLEIVANITFNLFFFLLCKPAFEKGETTFFARLYKPEIGIGYVFLSNLFASFLKLLLLLPSMLKQSLRFDKDLLKKMIRYAFPMVIVGLAYVVNEMLDRAMLPHYLSSDQNYNRAQTGIYSAAYKLSIFLSLFIQAFRFAAEPFFFNHAAKSNDKKIYADVMNWFVIFCSFIFLGICLFLDYIKFFIGDEFHEGLKVVPILLLANLFLGIYTSLSIWYKLIDKTTIGAFISVGGAILTVILNIILIPKIGYIGCAWATLICYFSMAVVSYFLGQKYFPIPYQPLKISVIIFTATLFVFLNSYAQNYLPSIVSAILFSLAFLLFVYITERKNLIRNKSINHSA